MDDKKIYLTKDGLGELKKEFDELTNLKRPEVLSRVAQARSLGDLSENAEYVAAREDLSFIDGRIDELEELLKQATLISESHQNHMVKLGSKVVLHANGKKLDYTVVGEWEADPTEKKISHKSPLGLALLGKRVGEKVEVEAPAGKVAYMIKSIN
ncbi:MAG TPA: transcription elongation factor GreA [Patescibacteria group bacterium]|nr:transcription elongation factor GreA [Patescibacteria group bacterium]